MILFGSRARGEELRHSDYDLVLVSPAFQGMPYPERIGALLGLWTMDVGLEPIALTPGEFVERAGKITVVAEAVRTGKEVWP
ncbi:MAG: nucleotidyltransferase domain-containing protein [Candidatus Bipolaricaulaceae bacterium]